LVSDQKVYTSEQQFAPLLANRRELGKQFGVVLRYQRLSEILARPKQRLAGYDVVGLKISYRTPAAEAVRITQSIREAIPEGTKLVYFDGDDDPCVLWPEVASIVDLYIKKHLLRDRSAYKKHRTGKTNLTDYVAETFGFDFTENIIPTSRPLQDRQIQKLALGWNIGADDKIRKLRNKHRAIPPASAKNLDIVCRATVPADSWMAPLRSMVIPQIDALRDSFDVLTPNEHVTQDVYYEEMLRSRICVSPFGYGEICWRDFEAILCGCVLVKPEMSHLETAPDIFVPNETYIPVRWDYLDLGERLKDLLERPEECERIRTRAAQVLHDYVSARSVLKSFDGLLALAGAPRTERPTT
tara:strand:+ start:763 stop:1830 length:1068 start_codon:yes stop_codon:yes gene_type:complete